MRSPTVWLPAAGRLRASSMPVSPSSAASFAAAPGQSTVSSAASAFPRSQHSAAPQHVPAVRVSVQDLEGDCERSCCLLVTGDIADLEVRDTLAYFARRRKCSQPDVHRNASVSMLLHRAYEGNKHTSTPSRAGRGR